MLRLDAFTRPERRIAMNRAAGGFVLIALFAASVVAGQTTAPAQPTPPSSATPSTQDRANTTSSSPYTSHSTQTALKDCITQTRVNHPQLTEQDALKVCKDAMSTATRD
jgi:hypothetical protein